MFGALILPVPVDVKASQVKSSQCNMLRPCSLPSRLRLPLAATRQVRGLDTGHWTLND